MKNLRSFRKYVPLLAATLLLVSSAAGQTKESSIAGGQVVDMGTYLINAPLGEEWKIQMNKTNGMVIFKQIGAGGKFTVITILPRPLNPGKENQTEDNIANMILSYEEKTMRERGAARSYAPTDLSREITTIGGKKLYVMNYAIMDRSLRAPVEIKYSMFLYLPPDLKQKRVCYTFLIGEAYKIGESVYEADLTKIFPVINSFQTK